jgi:hypothetical protein
MYPNSIFIFLGVILILVGASGIFSRKFLEWQIKMSNEMRGVSTKITSGTIATQKFQHVIFLILGLGVLFLGIFFCSIFALAC